MHSWILPRIHVLKTLMIHLIPKVVPKSGLQLLDHPSLWDSSGLRLLDFHFLDELLHQPINNHVLVNCQLRNKTNISPLQQDFLQELEAITHLAVVDY